MGSVKVIGDGLLRAISEATGGGAVLFDSKGNILEADRNFLKMLKYDEGHPEDITWDALTPPDYHEIDQSKDTGITRVRHERRMAKGTDREGRHLRSGAA